jgi:uncharacterized membrane protein YeaQ/YmgE (transglycosylase-associated protein family)
MRFGARKRCFGGFLGCLVGGLTAPYTWSNRPLWTAGFRVVSAVVGACVLRLLVVFVPRTSSTPVATWFWQTEGRSAERVILGVRPSEFILSEFQSPSRRIFIGSHSLPPLWSPNRCFKWYQSRFGSLLTLTSLRSKDGVLGTGFGSSTLRWQELPDVE